VEEYVINLLTPIKAPKKVNRTPERREEPREEAPQPITPTEKSEIYCSLANIEINTNFDVFDLEPTPSYEEIPVISAEGSIIMEQLSYVKADTPVQRSPSQVPWPEEDDLVNFPQQPYCSRIEMIKNSTITQQVTRNRDISS